MKAWRAELPNDESSASQRTPDQGTEAGHQISFLFRKPSSAYFVIFARSLLAEGRRMKK